MRILHRAHLAAAQGAHRRFVRALSDPEGAQRARLAATLEVLGRLPRWRGLEGSSWESFTEQAPLTTWQDLVADFSAQRKDGIPRACPPVVRWQPTSGATAERKWVPYPRSLLSAFDEAAGAWLSDLARLRPEAFAGRHYWSLSWLPDELRSRGVSSDDRELLGVVKRLTLGRLMAVPRQVAEMADAESALVATATHLAATGDLTLLSVWSPTFALALLATLGRHRDTVAGWLERGRWPYPHPAPRRPGLAARLRRWGGAPSAEIVAALWPRLALVSAWDSASSAPYACELKALTRGATFQGKGLWATEGVVTIPFRRHWPLALNSHVIELRCLASGRVLPPWAVESGQEVQPLLTTTGGLVRYALPDRLAVTGRLERTPCLSFRGRLGGCDLVGEKLERKAVEAVLARLEQRHGVRHATLWAVTEPAHYALVAELEPRRREAVAEALESALGEHHHYSLARELGQIETVAVHPVTDAMAVVLEVARRSDRGAGECKPESLATWPLDHSPAVVLAEIDAPRGSPGLGTDRDWDA